MSFNIGAPKGFAARDFSACRKVFAGVFGVRFVLKRVISLARSVLRGVMWLHDYVRGALEALSWVKWRLINVKKDPEGMEKVIDEINEAIEDINKGVAIDFRERLRTY